MKTISELKDRLQNLEEQKEYFEKLEPDIQTIDLNFTRVNLIKGQINFLKWVLNNDNNTNIKERLVQALDDFGVGNEMYDDTNEKLADYLIEVIEEFN